MSVATLASVHRIFCAAAAALLALSLACCLLPVAHAAGFGAIIDATLVEKTPGASLQAGAKAYLLKGMTIDDLLNTIRLVHAGKTSISPAIAEKLAERMSTQDLTARELAVLERIVAGRANKEIASDLAISEATVKTHVNNLLSKLGVSDRTNAATVAIQRGLVHFK